MNNKNERIKKDDLEVEKSKAMIIVEIIEYVADSVVIKTIIKKATGNINAVSFDTGETLDEKTRPYDKFIQIIDGKAEVIIDNKSEPLEKGQSIIIPAHSNHSFKANSRFKMISTTIKSGYEDVDV
jgi:quercetin dioxygenase-like cupin family protein